MKLSVIIPVYNGQKTIERCLKSIFTQNVDRSEYEVIVVDDCSTDSTVEVVENLRITPPISKCSSGDGSCVGSSNLVIVRQSRNTRQGAARNVGVRIARGTFVQYLDADDYLVDGSLADLLSAIDEYETDILMFDSETCTEDGRVVDSLHYSKNPRNVMSGEDFLSEAEVPWVPWLTVFRRSFLMDNQILFAEGVRFEDTDYMLKAFLLSKSVVYCPIKAVCHIMNLDSTVHGLDLQKIKERFMTSDRISATIADYRAEYPKGAKALGGHNSFLYDALLKRNLWRLGYSDIVSILQNHEFKGDNATPLITWAKQYPRLYSLLSQVARPVLLAMIYMRKRLK